MASATNIEALPLENLRTLLSNAAKFQSWTGTGSPAAALGRIHVIGHIVPLSLTKPYAIIGYGDTFNVGSIATASWEVGGEVNLAFVDALVGVGDPAGLNAFMSTVGLILEQMLTLSGGGGFFDISGLRRSGQPLFSPYDDDNDDPMMQVMYTIEYEGSPYRG